MLLEDAYTQRLTFNNIKYDMNMKGLEEILGHQGLQKTNPIKKRKVVVVAVGIPLQLD